MKSLSQFIKESINENISDRFSKLYNPITKSSDPFYKKYDYYMKHGYLDDEDYYQLDGGIRDGEFINAFTNRWGPGDDEYQGNFAIDKYLRTMYGVKLLSGGLVGGNPSSPEGHFYITVVDLDSKKRTGEFKGFSDFEASYTSIGANTADWTGDVNSTHEYATEILKYIKKVMR